MKKSSLCHQQVGLVLLSLDINFHPLLTEFKMWYKSKIYLIHNDPINDILVKVADEHFLYTTDFIKDLPEKIKSSKKAHKIIVKNLSINAVKDPSVIWSGCSVIRAVKYKV